MALLPLEDARRRILDACRPLSPVELDTSDALGCVLAAQVRANEDVPPFANTAVDGFAVRATDVARVPARLEVVATLPAGADPAGMEVGPGEAVRIMTGAPLPAGADAVVMVEDSEVDGEVDGEVVTLGRAARPGDHVRAAGDDVEAGQVVFEVGVELGPGHLGVLAGLGAVAVRVFPRARVGVLSTGDELVDDGRPLRPGQIRDSNRVTLLSLLAEANCVPVDLGVVGDDEDAITRAIEGGIGTCEALVTSGGVSMGDFDYVKAVLDRMGEMQWWQVAIKPAKPLAFGVVAGKPVFGLPGNPVSSMVSFELFARPALRTMMGHRQPTRPYVRAVAAEELRRRPDGKVHFVRVVACPGDDGRLRVRSAGGQGSHQLTAMARANALAVLPDGEGVDREADVDVLVLS